MNQKNLKNTKDQYFETLRLLELFLYQMSNDKLFVKVNDEKHEQIVNAVGIVWEYLEHAENEICLELKKQNNE